MTFALTSPVTGLAQTGLTSPTYTIVSDTPPDVNSKQYAVTALGGTQTGVLAHSVAAPFTCSMFRPKSSKVLQPVNPVTGVLRNVPNNSYSVVTRKGVLPLAGQAYKPMIIRTIVDCPAGADTADPLSVRAALAMHFGAVSQASAGIGDTVVNGVL
jgi:hypothetical protein